MDIIKTIEKVADNILHLRCDNKRNCFTKNFTDNRATEHKIKKGSVLIVNPVSCNHKCEPSKECLEHFKYAGFVVRDIRNEDEFTAKLRMQASFSKQDTALFANYEDAYNWGARKAVEQSG